MSDTYLARLPPELSSQLFSPKVYRDGYMVVVTTPGIYVIYFKLRYEVVARLSDGQLKIGQGDLVLRMPKDAPWARLLLKLRMS